MTNQRDTCHATRLHHPLRAKRARNAQVLRGRLGLTTRFLHESGDYGELETGSTALAFSSHSLMQQLGKNPQAANAKAPCFEIALCTPDVAAAVERAVADINGFLVELCTPMS